MAENEYSHWKTNVATGNCTSTTTFTIALRRRSLRQRLMLRFGLWLCRKARS